MITPAGSHSSGNRIRVVAVPVIVLAVLGLLLYRVFGGPPLSDQDQLVSILDDIRSGVARQDVGQTMGHTSSTFEASTLNRQQARLEVAQFYRMHAASSLLLRQPQIQINGSTATVQVYAELDASPAITGGMAASAASSTSGPMTTVYHGNVILQFQRQDTRRLGIFPSHEWRLVKAQVPNLESVEGL